MQIIYNNIVIIDRELEMNFNLNKIVKEWSYRAHDGMPDVKNPLHIVELQSLLYEMKYPRKFIEGLLRRLREERVKAWNKGTKSRPEGFWTTVSPDTLEDPVKGKQYSTEGPEGEDEKAKKGAGEKAIDSIANYNAKDLANPESEQEANRINSPDSRDTTWDASYYGSDNRLNWMLDYREAQEAGDEKALKQIQWFGEKQGWGDRGELPDERTAEEELRMSIIKDEERIPRTAVKSQWESEKSRNKKEKVKSPKGQTQRKVNQGDIELSLNGINNEAHYSRWFTLLDAHPAFQGDNREENTMIVQKLHTEFDNDPPDIEEIKRLAEKLNSQGLTVNTYEVSAGRGRVSLQVRINGAPLWGTEPLSRDSEEYEKYKEKFEQEAELSRLAKGATDSPRYKPQRFIDNLGDEKSYTDNSRKPSKTVQGRVAGAGSSGRSKMGESIYNGIFNEDGSVKDEYKNDYTKGEREALKKYAKLLQKPEVSQEQLMEAFRLMQTGLHANEVLKNFGELHTAMMMSYDYPDAEIVFPTGGNEKFHDVVLIEGDDVTGIHVIPVSIKKEGGGAPSSAWGGTYSGFIYQDTDEGRKLKNHLDIIEEESKTKAGKKSEKFRTSVLDLMNREEAIITDANGNRVQLATYIEENIKDFTPPLPREASGKSLEQIAKDHPEEFHELFSKEKKINCAIKNGVINKHVDATATKEAARVAYTFADGHVELHCNDPIEWKCYGTKGKGKGNVTAKHMATPKSMDCATNLKPK